MKTMPDKSKQRKKVFKVLAFWAHPTIRAEFPGHVLLVRKYYAAVNKTKGVKARLDK